MKAFWAIWNVAAIVGIITACYSLASLDNGPNYVIPTWTNVVFFSAIITVPVVLFRILNFLFKESERRSLESELARMKELDEEERRHDDDGPHFSSPQAAHSFYRAQARVALGRSGVAVPDHLKGD